MRYNLPAITTTSDKALAKRPEISVESRWYYSYEEVTKVAEIRFTGAGAAAMTLVPDIADILTGGADLQLSMLFTGRTAAQLLATISIDGATVSAEAATATWGRRAWTEDQTYNVPQFLATDLIATEAVDTINALSSFTGGSAGMVVGVHVLPTTWYKLNCRMESNISRPTPEQEPIACDYNPSEWAPEVRPDSPGQVGIKALHRDPLTELARLEGQGAVTLREDVLKGGRILTERNILGGCLPKVTNDTGENKEKVLDDASSLFTSCLRFI